MNAPADAVHGELPQRLFDALPAPARDQLRRVATLAATAGVDVYLVGGPVRDLLMGKPITDLDLVVAGDAWPIAEQWSAATGGRLTLHAQFRTAVVEITDHGTTLAIDFVTARREHYPEPAALPVVTPSNMRDDLARRDFTINTLALQLVPAGAAALLDPFGARRDIDAGIIRVLHDRSFIDDPTRILRAARFAGRFRFRVEPHTDALATAAVADAMIARTSPQRILHEINVLLDEAQPERALHQLERWGAMPQLGIRWHARWNEHFTIARQISCPVAQRLVGFGIVCWPLDRAERALLQQRYNLPGEYRKLLDELPAALSDDLGRDDVPLTELEARLQPLGEATLCVLQSVAPPLAAMNIARYRTEIRPLPPLITGNDLRALGFAPGPAYRTLLAGVRTAQLAGTITTPEQARQWITRHARQEGT